MSEEVYRRRSKDISPIGVSITQGRARVNWSRETRLSRRARGRRIRNPQWLESYQGFRSLRSLPDRTMARIETISRVAKHSRHRRARIVLNASVKLSVKRSVAIPQTTIRLLVIYCYKMLRNWPKVDRVDYTEKRESCLTLCYISLSWKGERDKYNLTTTPLKLFTLQIFNYVHFNPITSY